MHSQTPIRTANTNAAIIMIGEKGADMIKGYLRSPVKVKPGKVKMPKKLAKAMQQTEKTPNMTPVQQIMTHIKTKFNFKEYFNRAVKRTGMSIDDADAFRNLV